MPFICRICELDQQVHLNCCEDVETGFVAGHSLYVSARVDLLYLQRVSLGGLDTLILCP
jgi:hypothetical protein